MGDFWTIVSFPPTCLSWEFLSSAKRTVTQVTVTALGYLSLLIMLILLGEKELLFHGKSFLGNDEKVLGGDGGDGSITL